MTKVHYNDSKKPRSKLGVVFCALCFLVSCCIALAFSITSAFGLEPSDDGSNGSERVVEFLYKDAKGVSSEMMSLLAVDDGQVGLKKTNEILWFDRVDFPEKFKSDCRDFYNRLIEASDNDGDRDYLIEDKYLDPYTTESSDEFRVFNGVTCIKMGSFDYVKGRDISPDQQRLQNCAYAVRAAFDRDHPEVFWLNGGAILMRTTTTFENYCTETVYLAIGGYRNASSSYTQSNVRIASFDNEKVVKNTINLRDARVKELLTYLRIDADSGYQQKMTLNSSPDAKANANSDSVDAVSGDVVYEPFDDAEIMRFFNKWLTENNGYNTSNLYTLESRYPLAFECISALAGRCGDVGPVCEAYARAFKVLCDAVNIPCVLVDGIGNSEAHMWNNVCLDGKWYAVDVTWNDPGNGSQKLSHNENENYFLVGSDTPRPGSIISTTFSSTHKVENQHFSGGLKFINGPVLEKSKYWRLDKPSGSPDALVQFDLSAHSFTPINIDFLDRDLGISQIYYPDVFTPLTDDMLSFTYTSEAVTLEQDQIGVFLRGDCLSIESDYEIVYENNVNAGTATLKIVGVGKYTGSKSVTFRIEPAKFEVVSMSVDDVVYTRSTLRPRINVVTNPPGLVEGTDYIVEAVYKNNVDAGVAEVTAKVTGRGNYTGSGSSTMNFTIHPKTITLERMYVPDMVYTGDALEPEVVVDTADPGMKKGVDYDIQTTYSNNVNAGIASVRAVVTGKGNYKGSYAREMNFEIKPKSIPVGGIYVEDAEYDGTAKCPNVFVEVWDAHLKEGINYDIQTTYSNNVNAGTAFAYVVVKGHGNYAGTSRTVSFTITPKRLPNCLMSASDAVYTGSKVQPKVAIQCENPSLRQGVDYDVTVKCSNNINAGVATASISVEGRGNYFGTVTRGVNFVIAPKKASLKKLTAAKRSVTAKWTKATKKWATGYQLRYSTSPSYRSGVKTALVKSVSTSQKSIKKLKSKKRYYVSIRAYKTVNGVKYYGAWSASKSVKVK